MTKKEIFRAIFELGIPFVLVVICMARTSSYFDKIILGSDTISFASMMLWLGLIIFLVCLIFYLFLPKRGIIILNFIKGVLLD